MTDMTPFEQRLGERLQREFSASLVPFEAGAIARAAMTPRRRGDVMVNRLGLGNPPAPRVMVRVLAVAAMILVAMTATLLLASALLKPEPRLVLVLSQPDLAVAKLDGSDMTVLTSEVRTRGSSHISWAPNGQHIAVETSLPGLLVLDRLGSTTVERPLASWLSQVAWSPDGERLAILDAHLSQARTQATTEVTLEVIGLDGGLVWSAPLPEHFAVAATVEGNLTWSPDGSSIAVTGFVYRGENRLYPNGLWIADPGAGTVREVIPAGEDVSLTASNGYLYRPSWASDGRLLVGRAGASQSGLWAVSAGTRDMQQIALTPNVTCPPRYECDPQTIGVIRPSPDGARVAFVDPEVLFGDGLSVVELGRNPVTSLSEQGTRISDIVWAPDGDRLFVQVGRNDDPSLPDLVSVDLATGARAVVVADIWAFDVLSPGP
jgi:dipeptidyl aminopeptidase/acylaminoacyl peptidase